MTFIAIGRYAILLELAFVIIFMAILTGGEINRNGIAFLVTLLAIHIHVLALERIVSKIMVKGVH